MSKVFGSVAAALLALGGALMASEYPSLGGIVVALALLLGGVAFIYHLRERREKQLRRFRTAAGVFWDMLSVQFSSDLNEAVRLAQWFDRGEDAALTALCERIYPKATSCFVGHEYAAFEKARNDLKDVLRDWGGAPIPTSLRKYLQTEVWPNHESTLRLSHYVERAKARSTGKEAEADYDYLLRIRSVAETGGSSMTKKKLTQESRAGKEIPVPKRKDFMRDLEKVVKDDESDRRDRGKPKK